MDRDNIKKVWAAFVEVQEGKKKKLDKVDKDELEKDFKDREDKDIDNDGDEDESDEYLHNRRKAVKKAIAKEEVEIEEAHGVGKQLNSANMEKAMRQALKSKENFKNGKVLWNFVDADVYMDIKPSRGQSDSFYKMFDRIADKLSKELNLEESVEQIDELSKKTLGSYVKKASGDLAGKSAANAAIAATQVDKPESEKADRKGLVRDIHKRMKGISKASDKLTKEDVEIAEEKMTDAQMKKREEYVKSMKSKASEFKDKYGDRWKDVMYATATKMAMKEDVMENKQTAGATAPESMEDKFTTSDKKFVQAHGGLQHAAEVDGVKAAADTAAAIKASEPGENHANRAADKSQGDKNVVPSATKVKEAKDLDQLMRILANK